MRALARFEILILTAAGIAAGVAAAAYWEKGREEIARTEQNVLASSELSSEMLASRVLEALRISASFPRALALSELWQLLTPDNAEGAVEAFSDSLAYVGTCELGPFIDALAQFDPAASFELSKGWPNPEARHNGFYRAAYHWGLSGDSLSAEQAIRMLAEPQAQQIAYRGIARGLAETSRLQEGTQLFARIPPEGRAIAIAMFVSWVLREDGPDTLIRWAESFPEDSAMNLKVEIMNTAITQIMTIDLPRAVAWVESFATKSGTPPSLSLLLLTWLRSDPDSALRWLESRPYSGDHAAALLNAVRQWRVGAPVEARKWVRTNQQAIRRLGDSNAAMVSAKEVDGDGE